jgi:multidrug efflux pump subunit AcrA (membrane-fusion protein)
VVGDGAAQVTVPVPLAEVSRVTPGLAATVNAAGSTTGADGTVTSVDLLPASSSGTGSAGATATSGSATPSYPAKVLVEHPPVALASGSTATVSLVVGAAADAVRVPVSAVAGSNAGTGTVSVLQAGTPVTRRVVLGAVGGGWAQVLSGVADGDRLVLADLSAALPTGTTGLRGLGGGFGGGNRNAPAGSATTGRGAARTG